MESMLLRYPTLPSIESHLEQLRLQEQDAMEQLARPEPKPGLHVQLHALLERIADERAGLEKSISEVFSAGSRF